MKLLEIIDHTIDNYNLFEASNSLKKLGNDFLKLLDTYDGDSNTKKKMDNIIEKMGLIFYNDDSTDDSVFNKILDIYSLIIKDKNTSQNIKKLKKMINIL